MKYIKTYEYQDWRKFKKKLREKDILKKLKYKEDDLVILKDGRKAMIYEINPYNTSKDYIGDYRKDYLITWLDREEEPGEFRWQSSVDENEIERHLTKEEIKKTNFPSWKINKDVEKYNL